MEVLLRLNSANLFDVIRPELTASSEGAAVSSIGATPTRDMDEVERFTWCPAGEMRLRLGGGRAMTASEAKGAVIRFTVWETEGERREVGHHSYTVAQLLLEAESGDQASDHLFEVVDMEQVYMGEARIEAELLEVDLRPVDESLAIAPGPVPAAGVLQEVMQHSIEAKLSGHGSEASTDY